MTTEWEQVDHFLASARNPGIALTELATLGLLVSAKWDLARSGPLGTPDATTEQAARFDQFSVHRTAELREQARTALKLYAASLPKPASKDGFWRGVWQGILAAFFYSILLAAAYIVIYLLKGGDAVELARTIVAPYPKVGG